MNKLRIAVLLAVLMALLVVGSAFAQVIAVDYDDTESNYWPGQAEDVFHYVVNGDFNAWSADSAWIAEAGVECDNDSGNSPDYWCVWGQDKAGWEWAHLSQTDLAEGSLEEKGESYGMRLFLRHQGNGKGSFYAGAWQPLTTVTEAGYYFINVSESIWFNNDRGTANYNSVAWYTISDTNDPWDSDDWRELDPYTVQCPNSWEVCEYAGRDETIWVEPGQFLHLIVAHKFPVFNASTVFLLDDVSMIAANDDPETNPALEDYTGFYDWYYDTVVDNDEFDDKCHWMDETCTGILTVITWDQDAPR